MIRLWALQRMCTRHDYYVLKTIVSMPVCIHMYACDHCDHTHHHNALYSLSTKHMSVYWTERWSTFDCKHSTPEGGHLEYSTCLQQKGVQRSASHSHYEMCSWQCSTVQGCVNELCSAKVPYVIGFATIPARYPNSTLLS